MRKTIFPSVLLLPLLAFVAHASDKSEKEKAFDKAVIAYRNGYSAACASSCSSLSDSMDDLKEEKLEAEKITSADIRSGRLANLQAKTDALQKQLDDLKNGDSLPLFPFVPTKSTLVSFGSPGVRSSGMMYSKEYHNIMGISVPSTTVDVYSKSTSSSSHGLKISSAPKPVLSSVHKGNSHFYFVIVGEEKFLGLSTPSSMMLFITGDTMKGVSCSAGKVDAGVAYLFKAQDLYDAAFPLKKRPSN